MNLSCHSQTSGSSLSGVVFDRYGSLYSDARINIKPLKKDGYKYSQQIYTDGDGKFVFSNLLSGNYQVDVVYPKSKTNICKLIYLPKREDKFMKVEIGNACEDMSEPEISVNSTDKIDIIKTSLLNGLSELFKDDKATNTFILSTKYIPFVSESKLSSLNIKLMSEKSLQAKAEVKGDFKYISISEFRVTGSCVAVSIAYGWRQGKKSHKTNLYLDGHGATFEYRKEAGQWVGKLFSSWVS